MKYSLESLPLMKLRISLDPVIEELLDEEFETTIGKTPTGYIYEIHPKGERGQYATESELLTELYNILQVEDGEDILNVAKDIMELAEDDELDDFAY